MTGRGIVYVVMFKSDMLFSRGNICFVLICTRVMTIRNEGLSMDLENSKNCT